MRMAPNLQARCSAQHDSTDLEFGHSELRNDFELWGIRLRLKHKGKTAEQLFSEPVEYFYDQISHLRALFGLEA